MEQLTIIIVFAAYLIMMLAIGWVSSGKAKNLGAYYLADRKLNKWVVALSAQASDMSGWLLMGLPGAIFLSGMSEMWIGVGLAIGTYVNWKTVAVRLRVYSHACGDAITIPDFFANRFHDKTGTLRMISALFILVFFLFYTASGFVACAKLFSTTFGMSYTMALLLGVFVVVSYTFLGGFLAVCWTDFVQGTLMFLALIAVPLMVMKESGGFSETVDVINKMNPWLLNLFTNANTGRAVSLISLVSCLGWGLGYMGMPHVLVRFMALDDARKMRESRWIAMAWVMVALGAAVAIGLLGRYYAMSRGLLDIDPETILLVMAKGLFPTVIASLILVAILAAIMSTADSQLLVSASAFSNDFYRTVLRKKASDRELVWVSRLTVMGVAMLAGGMALWEKSDFVKGVMNLVSFAWGGFGATFGPLMILALFWRRTTFAGAVSGMVVGGITTFVWKFYLSGLSAPIFQLYELVPGFALSFLTIVVVSLIGPAPKKEITEEFDRITASIQP